MIGEIELPNIFLLSPLVFAGFFDRGLQLGIPSLPVQIELSLGQFSASCICTYTFYRRSATCLPDRPGDRLDLIASSVRAPNYGKHSPLGCAKKKNIISPTKPYEPNIKRK